MEIDHLVVWVEDQRSALAFYRDVLGLASVREEAFLAGQAPFPSVRVSAHSIVDLMARRSVDGVRKLAGERIASGAGLPLNHFCLALDAVGFAALGERLSAHGTPLTAAGRQYGAHGDCADSFYFQDPAGNVIEARTY